METVVAKRYSGTLGLAILRSPTAVPETGIQPDASDEKSRLGAQ